MSKTGMIIAAVKNGAAGATIWVGQQIPWGQIGWDVAIDAVQLAAAAIFCISL